MLLVSSVAFGLGFAVQRSAQVSTGVGPLTFSSTRNAVSAIIMLTFRRKIRATFGGDSNANVSSGLARQTSNTKLWKYGLIAGISMTGGSGLQQIGLVSVPAGKAAFLTSLYVIIIPFVECDAKATTYISATVAAAGVYLLSGCAETGAQCTGGPMGYGDFAILVSLAFWVLSFINADRAADAQGVNVIDVTTVEFSVAAVLSLFLSAALETHEYSYPLADIYEAATLILLSAVLECVGFTLSILAQEEVSVSRAALISSLDGVVAAFAGLGFLSETMTMVGVFGAVLVVVSTTVTSSDDGAHKQSTTGVFAPLPLEDPDTLELVAVAMYPRDENQGEHMLATEESGEYAGGAVVA
jgi:drug/metabolite transporter (DMT)-like permease